MNTTKLGFNPYGELKEVWASEVHMEKIASDCMCIAIGPGIQIYLRAVDDSIEAEVLAQGAEDEDCSDDTPF